MTQRTPDEVRVHSCLYGYCPSRREDCKRCDAVAGVLARALLETARGLGESGSAKED